MAYNVLYDTPNGSKEYLHNDCSKETAEAFCQVFKDRYVGKPYPNGKGYYQVSNPRVIRKG